MSKNSVKFVVFLCITVAVAGCYSNTSTQKKTTQEQKVDFSNRYFGEKPNISERQIEIEEAIKKQLKDPDSAKFKSCISPRKAHTLNGIVTGWATLCPVNAKNSFGGYTGYKMWIAFFVPHQKDKTVKASLFKVANGNSKHDISVLLSE